MEHLLEFIVNNPFLWGALAVVLVMLIKSEYDHQTNRANQLNPVNATRLMNNHEDAVVLDVRETSDFSKGHIKNAKNVPLSALKERVNEISKNKDTPVLAYCSSGNVSNRACRLLQQAGFNNVHNITGGLNGWVDAKLPVTSKK